MGTYKQIQEYIKDKYGITVKTCWIADVKEKHNIVGKPAHNRKDQNCREHPCPKEHVAKIEEAFKYFKLI